VTSSSVARLFCDEDVDGRLVDALRRKGFDVETAAETRQLNASDDEQLSYAVLHQHALITHNIRHFPVMHAQWVESQRQHWGVLILVGHAAIGPWLRQLDSVLGRFSSDGLKDQLIFISPARDVGR